MATHRDALLRFAERVEWLPIAVVVGADLLRREFDPISVAARGLRLEQLRTRFQDVPGLFQRTIEARPTPEQSLLRAMAACSAEGFWLSLAMDVAALSNGKRVKPAIGSWAHASCEVWTANGSASHCMPCCASGIPYTRN